MGQLVHSGGTLHHTSVLFAPTWDVDLVQSVFFFLSGTSFTRQIGDAGGPLAYHYPKLSMSTAYPRNLSRLDPPHLALEQTLASAEEAAVFGSGVRNREKQFVLWGFAGSFQDTAKDAWERTQLMGDMRQLISDARIPVYDFSSGTSVTEIGKGNADLLSAESLPPNVPLAVENYKFQVTFRVEY